MSRQEWLKNSIFYRPLLRIFLPLRRLYWYLGYLTIEYSYRFLSAFGRHAGVTDVKRDPELIVSLTTIPERIGKVHLCIESLLRQNLQPDHIILWLSESENPNRPKLEKASLPLSLVRLQRRGLDIRWCRDIRSFRKIVPTLHVYPDALIVTADDDIFYPRGWLRGLYDAYRLEPQYVHCHRAHLITYDSSGNVLPYRQWNFLAPGYQGPSMHLFPTSGGGVLYAPGHLHPEVLNENVFLKLCPKADDVWLKEMSLLAGVQCKKVAEATFRIWEIKIKNNRTLSSFNFMEEGNDPQIKAVAEWSKMYVSKRGY
ncbi:hypothetical protein JWJ90_00200 [Desulfobulbus rhabdoformis]|uniref:hypothetical protein n=1 Tax=Desulfobulbus rhabdoformis TaxID=34032 RepID=UPI0019650BBC|nr:hypothetical protein [Desulfobulbus rhabdoformis]MBM9612700.1 hypothetical protein [Desulfobulbus rhabdoformis]